MEIFQADGAALKADAEWFPHEIESDPWVIYHGTSSVNEAAIDAEGFTSAGLEYADAAIRAVQIFRSLDWDGHENEKNNGYVVLNAFSLERSHLIEWRPIYFALYPLRTRMYLWKEFCAGESASALRKFTPSFLRFASDPEIQRKHFESNRKKIISSARQGLCPSRRAVIVDPAWLAEQAEFFTALKTSLDSVQEKHTHGVIYAVRVSESDLNDCSYSWQDSLRLRPPISKDAIIAKLQVFDPESIERDDFEALEENAWREQTPLVEAISRQSKKGERQFHSARDLRDPSAGTDVTFEIAKEFGAPEMRAWAESQLGLPFEKRFCPIY